MDKKWFVTEKLEYTDSVTSFLDKLSSLGITNQEFQIVGNPYYTLVYYHTFNEIK